MRLNHSRLFAKVASILTVLIGCIVLLGWLADLETLKSLVPGLPTMKVNTALGFVFSGMSLWGYLAVGDRYSRWLHGLAWGGAVAVLMLGLLVLIEYGFNINFGIDELLIRDINQRLGMGIPGRMAAETAFNFLLFGSALSLLQRERYIVAQSFAAVGFLIGLLALVGYTFQVQEFYNLTVGTSMALPTSFTFLILMLGFLLSCPDRGWVSEITSSGQGGVTIRRLLPVILSLPLLLGGAVLYLYQYYSLSIEAGIAWQAILNIAVLGGVSLWNARFLNQLDTKQQQTEGMLRQFNEQLETKVAERTVELAMVNQSLHDNFCLLESVLESIPDSIFLKDCDGRYLLLNTAACQTIGRSQAEIIGRTDRELFSLEIAELLMHHDRVVLNSSESQIFEEQALQAGTPRIFLSTKRVWRDQEGVVKGLLGIARDITEQQIALRKRDQAEEALRLSEERYRSLIEATAHSVWVIDANGYTAEVASSWIEATGQLPQVGTAWQWLEPIHPDDRERVKQTFSRCLKTGELYEIEHRVLSKAGEYRLYWVKGAPVYNADGSIREWVGTLNDITERRQAEEALRQSESKLRSVLENMPMMLVAFDQNGNIIVWNQECERVTGYTAEEIIHNPQALELLYPDSNYRQQMLTHWQERGNDYRNWEWDLVSKSGEVKTIAWSNISDYFAVPGWSTWGVGIDLTSRKQAELEILLLNQTLEQRVNQRTAELTAVNQELEAFSYSVSHDLRAPLRGIDGFSQLLQERYADQLDDKGQHYLSRIRAGTQRMGELIDDLLMLSRVTRTELQREPVDLSAIAREVSHNLGATQPSRSVEWIIPEELWVVGDARLLQIVLENLLNNAWKFTSMQTHARIEFGSVAASELVLEPQNQSAALAFLVKDNGVGFNMAYANKLFKAFQRLHSEQEFPGTGIGLAIVQRIVHRHGGSVWAEGILGQGAAFYFTLG